MVQVVKKSLLLEPCLKHTLSPQSINDHVFGGRQYTGQELDLQSPRPWFKSKVKLYFLYLKHGAKNSTYS
jgi:hypothetical protein